MDSTKSPSKDDASVVNKAEVTLNESVVPSKKTLTKEVDFVDLTLSDDEDNNPTVTPDNKKAPDSEGDEKPKEKVVSVVLIKNIKA